MPTYEYGCGACGHQFELVQRITEAPKAACPKCGKKARRLISSGNFILKGTGWYKTDYASKEVKRQRESDQKSDSKATPSNGATTGSAAES